jgi:hypothetical protein
MKNQVVCKSLEEFYKDFEIALDELKEEVDLYSHIRSLSKTPDEFFAQKEILGFSANAVTTSVDTFIVYLERQNKFTKLFCFEYEDCFGDDFEEEENEFDDEYEEDFRDPIKEHFDRECADINPLYQSLPEDKRMDIGTLNKIKNLYKTIFVIPVDSKTFDVDKFIETVEDIIARKFSDYEPYGLSFIDREVWDSGADISFTFDDTAIISTCYTFQFIDQNDIQKLSQE